MGMALGLLAYIVAFRLGLSLKATVTKVQCTYVFQRTLKWNTLAYVHVSFNNNKTEYVYAAYPRALLPTPLGAKVSLCLVALSYILV